MPLILPMFAVAAAVTGAYALCRRTGACTICEVTFRPVLGNRTMCTMCGADFCSKHVQQVPEFPYARDLEIAGQVCDRCWPQVDRRMNEYASLMLRAQQVEVFSKNYRGRIPVDQQGPCDMLESTWYRRRDEAELEVKVAAARRDVDIIYDLSFSQRTNQDGNYLFTEWMCAGVSGRRSVT